MPHLAARLRVLGMTSTSLLWLASEADSSIPLPEELLEPCAPSESPSSEPSALASKGRGQELFVFPFVASWHEACGRWQA